MEFNYKKIKVKDLKEMYTLVCKGIYSLNDLVLPDDMMANFFNYVYEQESSVFKDYCLGYCYKVGQVAGVTKDLKRSVTFLSSAANRNHAISCFELGYIYAYEGTMKDEKQASDYWKRSLMLGYLMPNLYFARRVIEDKSYFNLVSFLQPLVDAGCCEALVLFADCYATGKGVNVDKRKSFLFYDSAAQQGDVRSQSIIGTYLEKGIGCKKDLKLAFKYYYSAAEKGNLDCQYNVGRCYDKGIGTVKSDFDAYRWYSNAAKKNHPKALMGIGQLYIDGRYVKKDIKKGFQFIYTAAVTYGDTDAQCYFGHCFWQGLIVPRDTHEAVQWFGIAAQAGNAEGQYNLANAYDIGEGINYNLPNAIKWYTKSANQGYANAEYIIGMCYLEGRGVMKNPDLAYRYLESAKAHGNELAGASLSNIKFR